MIFAELCTSIDLVIAARAARSVRQGKSRVIRHFLDCPVGTDGGNGSCISIDSVIAAQEAIQSFQNRPGFITGGEWRRGLLRIDLDLRKDDSL